MKPNTTCVICGYRFYTKKESICTECHINLKLTKIENHLSKISEAICYAVFDLRRKQE